MDAVGGSEESGPLTGANPGHAEASADPRFRANDEVAAPGLARFVRDVVHAKADRVTRRAGPRPGGRNGRDVLRRCAAKTTSEEWCVQVEIWSDIVCPWCAIGKRRFEASLDGFPHRDQVEVVWRSFELDPHAPRERAGGLTAHLAEKYGTSRDQAAGMQSHMTATAAGEGLDFHFERARPGNTFDAHRLLHLAREGGRQDAVKERLLTAYLTEGEPIGDPGTLVRLAADAGVDAAEAGAVLDGGAYADAVRADEAEAQALGVAAVPFFVFDRRYGVSGAQPAPVLRAALERAWDESRPITILADDATAEACADGACAV
ncbi:MAG: DsbA family protein [Euzebyaceae bacterium]|jgi:predicted DsbA family dithiol-disulfide isomerase|nr:DsbA family protein [Euzebyaceae bacterium]